MANSWQALFFVSILILASPALASSYEVNNSTNQTNTTVITVEIGKTWLAINPIQCGGNPWEKANQTIQDYYKSQGVTIYNDKISQWIGYAVCEACFCSNGSTLYVLVSNSDVDKMMKFGYVVATGNLTKDMTLAHSPLNYYNTTLSTPEKPNVVSPLKQLKTGISTYSVICKEGFVLVIKKSDNSPACVKPDTAQKLVERGWGVLKEKLVWFEYTPVQCQHMTDWERQFSTSSPQIPESYIIKQYFKSQGITIFDMKEWYFPTQEEPQCGKPSDSHFYYFLVSESDVDKMIKLGYKTLTVPMHANTSTIP